MKIRPFGQPRGPLAKQQSGGGVHAGNRGDYHAAHRRERATREENALFFAGVRLAGDVNRLSVR
jgi:hypothetical protein